MHELSLMADLLQKIESVARDQRASRVVSVNVRLGALSHISASHFREHFEQAVSGGVAAGSRLQVEVGEDMTDPQALDIVLTGVEVEVAAA